jgi:hypothetical protein
MEYTPQRASQPGPRAAPELVAAAAALDGVLVPELRGAPPLGESRTGAPEPDVQGVLSAAAALEAAGARLLRLEIAPLSDPWQAPPDPAGRRFKSGCAPVLALERARDALGSGEAEAVLIHGADPLRTGYSRAERRQRMDIWPGRFGAGQASIPQAYTRLVEAWLARHGIPRDAFEGLADALLERCAATARARGITVDLAPLRAVRVTPLFRLGDCANPDVDFRGAALLLGPRESRRAQTQAALRDALAPFGWGAAASARGRRVWLAGVANRTRPDGPDHLKALARYAHLAEAARSALQQAGLAPGAPLRRAWQQGRLLLEAYTCFPVVPLAFLVETGLAEGTVASLRAALQTAPLTVTGGMNLARAPWNNPVLHALAVMWARLRQEARVEAGLLHGNGGLGGWQGLAVLRAGG